MRQPQAIIVAAMDDELAPFLERATDLGEPFATGNSIHRGARLAGHDVMLVTSGIGLVNAASATVAAILSAGGARPMVLSAGSAGGLGSEVRVGDVVVGSEYINLDADARVFGYVLGQVPRMPASYSPRAAELAILQRAHASEALLAGSRLHVGLMVSSYSFVTPERARVILESFPASQATDMESVAIAQVAHSHGLSFMSVRGISDLCSPGEHDTHVDDAAARSAAVVEAVLPALIASLDS
jgi:adenosylhomocysteine nucleosidase